MPSLRDVADATDELQHYAEELRLEIESGDPDFGSLAELSDQISEHADGLASMFQEVDQVLSQALERER